MVGALVSGLLWVSGRSQGIARADLRRALARLWLAVIACVLGLVAVRAYLGGWVFDIGGQGEPLLRTRHLGVGQWALVVAGIGWTVAWLVVALRIVADINGGPTDSADPSSRP